MATAGLFFAIGRRFGRSLGREFSALGSVLLIFALYGALTLLPTAFGLWGIPLGVLLSAGFFLAVQVPALGLLVLTRVGTRRITNETPAPAAALAMPR